MNQKGQVLIIGVVIGLLIAAGLFGAYHLGKQNTSKLQLPTSTVTPSSTPDVIVNWKTYTNKTYGYSFKYPQDWNLDISKAESATANNPPASPGTSRLSLAKDGYVFAFEYNLSGIGGVASIASRTEEITIDNKKFLKTYTYSKADPQCLQAPVLGIDQQTGKELQPKPECYQYFDQLYINDFLDQRANSSVTISGKNAVISLDLPVLTKLDDKAFAPYNTIFDQILSTLKFTDQNTSNYQTCQTDQDCQNGYSCRTVGPVIKDVAMRKQCIAPGVPVPL